MTAWTYSQRSGELCDPSGACVAVGYSGADEFKNRPAAEARPDEGPLPTGLYVMGSARDDDNMGPQCIPLEPDPGNEMHSRYGFYVHGDTSPPGEASTGCIIMPRAIRDMLDASDVRELIVTT